MCGILAILGSHEVSAARRARILELSRRSDNLDTEFQVLQFLLLCGESLCSGSGSDGIEVQEEKWDFLCFMSV